MIFALIMKHIQHYILMLVFFAGVFSYCIHRDIGIEKQYTWDLRNRVVGARLQKDGISPYFFHWRPEMGLRYYDPYQSDTTFANTITASPFFHHVLFPIADLPERKISGIWLGIEYLMLFISLGIGFSLAKSIKQKWLCVFAVSCFMLTEGWIAMIAAGQMYLLIPFCCIIIYWCLERKKKSSIILLIAGITSGVLILSK